MKIQELNLVAFGPFTDKSLAFNQKDAGLHIIYGLNEAGKSSALRGLNALLYGIDARTADNFIHKNESLLIKGCLQNADGHELRFGRRKGNKNTLLSIEGDALDDQVLTSYLHGVTPELFEMLFGIDHQALRRGGEEILEQKGEVGQALYSAAIGSHALHAVLKQLDDEADALFRPQGSTKVINSALKSYKELEKEIKSHSLSSREWEEHHRAFAKASGELTQIQNELSGRRSEVNRLKRVQRLLPKFAQRRELLQVLESLRDVVILAEDFLSRHQQALKELDKAQAILDKATPRLQGLESNLDDLIIRQDVLAQAESIEDLHSKLGGHRKALQERPELEMERQLLIKDAEDLLKKVRPDLELKDSEKLHPLLAKRQSITALGNKYSLIVEKEKQAESSLHGVEAQLKSERKERKGLPEISSTDGLRRTIVAARKLGDLDAAIQSSQSELTNKQSQCTEDLSRLTLWTGSLQDLPGLAVPSRESINHFEQVYDDLEQSLQRMQEKQDDTGEALQDALLRLDEFNRTGTIPSEEELVAIRTERDRIWQLLRRQWINNEDISDEISYLNTEATLPDVFEERLEGADELSDRLRREADRVHKMASLQAGKDALNIQLIKLDEQQQALKARRSEYVTEWQALWAVCDIQPRTPREMRSWLVDAEKLRDQVSQLNSLRQKFDELKQIRESHIQLLHQQLKEITQPVSKSEFIEIIILECEETAQQIDENRNKHDEMDKSIKTLESNLDTS